METNLKKCPKCEQVKATSEFHKNASAKDGLQNYCKACQYVSQRMSVQTMKPGRNLSKCVNIGK